MEDRVKEYTRHYKKETQLLKEETTKRKKHLTYIEKKEYREREWDKEQWKYKYSIRTNAQQEHVGKLKLLNFDIT